MHSKIETAIEAIEDYLANCKFQTFSTDRIIVNKDEIEELIRELKQATPEEINTYRQIISRREAILNDAQMKANQLIEKTQAQTNELISEHEIMQQAYAKANEVVTLATRKAQDILDNATIEANSVKAAAMQYTDDLLANLESIITQASQNAQANYSELISNLNSCNAVVKGNRTELHPTDDDDLQSLVIAGEGDDSGLDLI